MNKWTPANPHIPISTTIYVDKDKEYHVERFADGRETTVVITRPKVEVKNQE